MFISHAELVQRFVYLLFELLYQFHYGEGRFGSVLSLLRQCD
jgi:hypothetical protein